MDEQNVNEVETQNTGVIAYVAYDVIRTTNDTDCILVPLDDWYDMAVTEGKMQAYKEVLHNMSR